MKLFWGGVLALLLCVPAARAQFAVYGEGQTVRFNNQANATTTWYGGGTFGAYYDFLRLPILGFGLDARGTFGSNGSQHFRSGMAGLRADLKAPVLPIRPYVEGLIGVGGTSSGAGSSRYDNKFEYEVLGGLDFTVFPHIDLRVPEIGYAQMSPVASGPNAPNSKLLEISGGVVIRLF